MSHRGRLVVFEGVDGCGKSTQVRRVADDRGALATFEPGDTPLGAALRAVVLDAHVTMAPVAELMVMAADRAQHVSDVVVPALEAGRDVLCDRFNGSTLAYQGYGRGLDLAALREVLAVATGGLEPDLTVLLDCPPELARSRRRGRGATDRFEGSDAAFAERVREGFRELAATAASWRTVDASRPLADVDRDVDAVIDEVLGGP